jgi:nicotinamidase-related amidase
MTNALHVGPGSALVVIELQNDLVHPSVADLDGVRGGLARVVRDSGLLARAAGLLDAWRSAGLPVVYVTRERHPGIPQAPLPLYRRSWGPTLLESGTWGAAVIDDVAPAEGDLVLNRFVSLDPSYGSGLWAALRSKQVDSIVVFGVSTTIAVEGTIRGAANRGLRSTVVADCCATVPAAWHDFSINNVLPLLADVVSAADVLASVTAGG